MFFSIGLFAKRFFDLLVVVISAPLFIPLGLLVALLVRYRLGSPVFFYQHRPGRNEKIFKLVKFRSMRDVVDADGSFLPDAERLTGFGISLRSSSLDELPTLWNVLCGHMSLVGPRPLLPDYLLLYNDTQRRRHEVRPGVTGLAQVNGRNLIDWDKKFDLDVWYVDNRTFILDLRIILATVGTVFKRDGISAAGESTISPFRGSDKK